MHATAHADHAAAPANIEPTIEQLVSQLIDGRWAPGVVVGLVRSDQTYMRGFGATGLGGTPDEHTVFEIGSVSKAFTGELLAEAVERGLVELRDPVSGYLPGAVTMPHGAGSNISFEQLATHRSGLPYMPDNLAPKDFGNPFADYTVDQLYEFLSAHRLSREPDQEYEYSNLGAGLLGHTLGLITSVPYAQLLREWITDPLGMDDTVIALHDAMKSRFAIGHDELGPVGAWDIPTLEGAGAIRSTGSDMLAFVRSHIESPTPAMRRATAMVTTRPGGTMGLGWHIGLGKMTDVRWHNGQTGGFHTFIAFDAAAKVGVVVLANANSDAIDRLGVALLALAKSQPYDFDLPPLAVVGVDVLARYPGEYELSPGFVLTVALDGDTLVVQATGQGSFAIFPASETRFLGRVVDLAIEFERTSDGVVTGLTLLQEGDETLAAKIR